MGVENGNGSRKNDVRNRHGLRGPWTVVRDGIVEKIDVKTVGDLIEHDIRVTLYSVGETFGPKAGQEYLNWLNGHQPRNGK